MFIRVSFCCWEGGREEGSTVILLWGGGRVQLSFCCGEGGREGGRFNCAHTVMYAMAWVVPFPRGGG